MALGMVLALTPAPADSGTCGCRELLSLLIYCKRLPAPGGDDPPGNWLSTDPVSRAPGPGAGLAGLRAGRAAAPTPRVLRAATQD
eukprot:747699-Hanusia_phi.AAC.1